MDGCTNKIAGVDLGEGEISIQETDAEMKRQYIGSLPFYPLCPECR
jgi:aldehyde:ferredoxin oxidoreductase